MRRWRPFRWKKTEPQIMWMFEEMTRQQVGLYDMSDRSGVSYNTINNWARGVSSAEVRNLEACYNVLGFSLMAVALDI